MSPCKLQRHSPSSIAAILNLFGAIDISTIWTKYRYCISHIKPYKVVCENGFQSVPPVKYATHWEPYGLHWEGLFYSLARVTNWSLTLWLMLSSLSLQVSMWLTYILKRCGCFFCLFCFFANSFSSLLVIIMVWGIKGRITMQRGECQTST